MKSGSVGESAALSVLCGRSGAGMARTFSSALYFGSCADLFLPASSEGGGLDLELKVRSVNPIEPYDEAESIEARCDSTLCSKPPSLNEPLPGLSIEARLTDTVGKSCLVERSVPSRSKSKRMLGAFGAEECSGPSLGGCAIAPDIPKPVPPSAASEASLSRSASIETVGGGERDRTGAKSVS